MNFQTRELTFDGDSQIQSVDQLVAHFHHVRAQTESICEPLESEDFVVQSMPDASPLRWHLAHTTWFFETFILREYSESCSMRYEPLDDRYRDLFNSYYNHVGKPFERAKRGVLSRPTVSEVLEYRNHVDHSIKQLLKKASPDQFARISRLMLLGIHHEQQHQELMITDLKHAWSHSPLFPQLVSPVDAASVDSVEAIKWIGFDEGIYEIGYGGNEFHFDNEAPQHRFFAESFEIAHRLATCGDYLEFIAAGGYQKPEYWLSMGWEFVNQNSVEAPLYWWKENGQWYCYTLAGVRPVDLNEPLTHISYFEADAFAKWSGCVLPSEQQWEIAANSAAIEGTFLESNQFHPQQIKAAGEGAEFLGLFGSTWQWTSSQYVAYPGYCAPPGAIGEYNGKFMCNQFVLRGGSCATPRSHIRRSYRNFFPPETRWQFTGLRLARYLL
jgi:ergothioneine biosynthesis protein EgtB